MKTAFHFGLSFICILLMMFGLTGCQLFDRLWPFGNAAEIENLLPDEEDLAKLEEEAQDLADLFREGEDTGTVPFKGDFMLNYLYDQTVDAFVVHASFTEKIEFEYPGGGDYTKATYYFDTSFSGTQEEEIAALYEGVYCWTVLEHQVDYHVSGTFQADTRTVKVIIEATPTKSEITGTSCPPIVPPLIQPAIYYIPPPDTEITISEMDKATQVGEVHQVTITDLHVP